MVFHSGHFQWSLMPSPAEHKLGGTGLHTRGTARCPSSCRISPESSASCSSSGPPWSLHNHPLRGHTPPACGEEEMSDPISFYVPDSPLWLVPSESGSPCLLCLSPTLKPITHSLDLRHIHMKLLLIHGLNSPMKSPQDITWSTRLLPVPKTMTSWLTSIRCYSSRYWLCSLFP